MLAEKIQELLAHVEDLKAKNAEQLELLRIKYLSKKGVINDLMTEFRNVPNEQKRELGMRINEVKAAFQDKINSLRQSLITQEDDHSDLDLTRTPYPIEIGTRHPISLVRDRLIDLFNRMGFTMAEGPEVEDDWHVFSSMNFAADHPARDMQDTFVVEQHPDIVLRSHTSSVQARVMEATEPPIRVICPGRVYRNEAISSRAHCFFHQFQIKWIRIMCCIMTHHGIFRASNIYYKFIGFAMFPISGMKLIIHLFYTNKINVFWRLCIKSKT